MNLRLSCLPTACWSIRRKLTAMAMGTTALALLLTVTGFALFEYFTFRHHLVARLQTLGEVIGGNSTAAIAFDRPDDAAATLKTLAAQKNIRAACIFKGDGALLARYAASDAQETSFPARPAAEGSHLGLDSMEVFLPVELDGKKVGMIYLRSDLGELSSRLTSYAWISAAILLAASGAGLLVVGRLQRYVSAPIMALAAISRRVTQEKDYTLRVPHGRGDELGQLSEAFNDMLEGIRQRDEQIQLHLNAVQAARDQLERRVEERTADLSHANAELQAEMARRVESERTRAQIQANLVEASRRAGMADVATGVLHNVGNVLNSINVSTQILQDSVKASRLSAFQKAVELLAEHQSDLAAFLTADSRGKALPAFLLKLAQVLHAEQDSLLKEFDGLTMNIGHIREIVAMQQSLARVSGVLSTVALGDLIDDALKINQAGLSRHQVQVIRDFDPAITLTIDRHKMLQILINLISNAKYAVDGTSNAERQIAIRARENGALIEMTVTDNGVGIERQNLTKIFGYGFTTKKHGHGFGLHSSALVAGEMGGSLQAHSDGPGKGATFIVRIPRSQETVAHAE